MNDVTLSMTDNPYQPPDSDPLAPQLSEQDQQFFVVSKLKFTLLYFMTFGLYEYYWLAVNWYRHRKATGISVWPLPRALFPIFFTHTLIFAIDGRIKEKKIDYKWNPQFWAILYVLFGVVYGILGVLNNSIFGTSEASIKTNELIGIIVEVAFILIDFYILLQVQKAINISHEDPTGSSNSKITVPNLLWILIGSFFWIISFIILAETLGWLNVNELLTQYF